MAIAKTEPNKPWSTFPVHVYQCVRAFFSMAVCTEVGDGAYTLFWLDKWIHGQYIADIAPHLFALVPKRKTNNQMVFTDLQGP